MDWIKIKTKHYFYSDYTIFQVGMLVSIQCLTAHLEKIPTEEQILKLPEMGRKRLQNLNKVITSHGQTLNKILTKVLEDVNKVHVKREQGKQRMAKLREKPQVVTRDVTLKDKIREDKITLDKKTTGRARFISPKIPEIKERIREMDYSCVDADIFYNHYAANGWMIGKNKMKDWHKALAGWESRNKNSGGQNNGKSGYSNGVSQQEFESVMRSKK